MSDLSEFLLTRIAEDQAAAQAEWDWMIERHGPDAWTTGEGAPIEREWAYETDRDWTLHVSPRRVLAECEAKRRIVEAESGRWRTRADAPIAEMRTDSWANRITVHFDTGVVETMTSAQFRDRYQEPVLSDTLRLLALPYADHPDYSEEWRP